MRSLCKIDSNRRCHWRPPGSLGHSAIAVRDTTHASTQILDKRLSVPQIGCVKAKPQATPGAGTNSAAGGAADSVVWTEYLSVACKRSRHCSILLRNSGTSNLRCGLILTQCHAFVWNWSAINPTLEKTSDQKWI